MILTVGGSGTLGRIVARQLLAGGELVRLMTRRPSAVEWARNAGAEVVPGDLLDSASLVRACTGVRAVVCAAHSMTGRGRNASVHVDDAAHRHLIDVAKSSGVQHVVYTSVHQPSPEYQLVPFFRIKQEVEDYLRTSGMAYTILRPTAFMDFHAHVLIGEPVLAGRTVKLIGRGERPRNFVAAQDVAAFVVRALGDPSLLGQTIAIGGPQNLSPVDVVRIYERHAHRIARVTRLPLVVARTVSRLTERLHPGVSQILKIAVLADTTDQPFDPQPLQARFGITLTDLDTWVSERLQHASLPAVVR